MMGAEARKYLEEHLIPQLFEGLMTGLIYNKPENPIDFLGNALNRIRKNPDLALKWDSFVDSSVPPTQFQQSDEKSRKKSIGKKSAPLNAVEEEPGGTATQNGRTTKSGSLTKNRSIKSSSPALSEKSRESSNGEMRLQRSASVTKAAAVAHINPDAPIILFMGGPGGGKTKHAAKIRDEFEGVGLVHICVPDLIKDAINRYKDRFPEWKEAARQYERGELIPNNLAQDLVRAEMGRFPQARAYFLEGFPREARQVEDFEQNVRTVNMADGRFLQAMILDYDENTLRKHMESRGLTSEVIDRRINEFRQKTLPSAKYFDDHRLLHLIPGEKNDKTIFERMRKLVSRAIETGVPVLSQTPMPSRPETPDKKDSVPESNRPADKDQLTSTQRDDEEQTDENSRLNGHSTPTSASVKAPAAKSSVGSNYSASDNASEPKQAKSSSSQESLVKNVTTTEAAKNRQASNSAGVEQSKPPKERKSATNETALQSASQDTEQPLTKRSDATTPKSQSANQSRPITNDNTHNQNVVNNSKPQSAAEHHVTRINVQTSEASTKPKVKSQQSSVERHTPTQQTSSKPPTGNSRPETESKKSITSVRQNSAGDASKTNASIENRPASSVASTPKAASTPNDPSTQVSSESVVSPNSSTVPTAANRFFKGLPNNSPVVLVIGAPGSNKAEIADGIAQRFDGFVHLSMGDLLRKKVQQNLNDELWSRVGKKMEAGEQIPMKICRDILYSTIYDMSSHSWGYIIEGYPRTLIEAEDIETQLGRLDIAVLIDCTEAFCKDNIRKRFEENRERSGGERLDDNEASAKQRLNLFKQNTLPMLKHLDDKGKLHVVRGERSQIEGDSGPEKLYDGIVNLLNDALFSKDGRNSGDKDSGDRKRTEINSTS